MLVNIMSCQHVSLDCHASTIALQLNITHLGGVNAFIVDMVIFTTYMLVQIDVKPKDSLLMN